MPEQKSLEQVLGELAQAYEHRIDEVQGRKNKGKKPLLTGFALLALGTITAFGAFYYFKGYQREVADKAPIVTTEPAPNYPTPTPTPKPTYLPQPAPKTEPKSDEPKTIMEALAKIDQGLIKDILKPEEQPAPVAATPYDTPHKVEEPEPQPITPQPAARPGLETVAGGETRVIPGSQWHCPWAPPAGLSHIGPGDDLTIFIREEDGTMRPAGIIPLAARAPPQGQDNPETGGETTTVIPEIVTVIPVGADGKPGRPNQQPQLTASLEKKIINFGEPAQLTAQAIDPDNDLLTLSYRVDYGSWDGLWVPFSSKNAALTGLSAGKHTVYVKAVDAYGLESKIWSETLEVKPVPKPEPSAISQKEPSTPSPITKAKIEQYTRDLRLIESETNPHATYRYNDYSWPNQQSGTTYSIVDDQEISREINELFRQISSEGHSEFFQPLLEDIQEFEYFNITIKAKHSLLRSFLTAQAMEKRTITDAYRFKPYSGIKTSSSRHQNFIGKPMRFLFEGLFYRGGGIDRYLQDYANDPTGYNNLGIFYSKQGRFDEAEQMLRKAIEREPNQSEPYSNLGCAYSGQGRFREAEQMYTKALELDPNNLEACIGLGCNYLEQERFDEAEQQFKKAIEINPKDCNAYNGLGYACYMQDRFDEAEQQFKKAIELDPKDSTTYNGLGFAYCGQKRFDEAEQAFRKAIELNPKHSKTYSYLGDAYLGQGRCDEAGQMFRKAIELDPENKAFQKNLEAVIKRQEELKPAN